MTPSAPTPTTPNAPEPVFTHVQAQNAPLGARNATNLTWWGLTSVAMGAGVGLAGHFLLQAPLWGVASATGAAVLFPPAVAKTIDLWRGGRRERAARTLDRTALVHASERALLAWVQQPGFPTIDGTWLPIAQWSCTEGGFDLVELAFGSTTKGDGAKRMRATLNRLPDGVRHLDWDQIAPEAGRAARKRLVRDDALWAVRGPRTALDTSMAQTLLMGRLDTTPQAPISETPLAPLTLDKRVA